MNGELRQLRYFVAVAEELNFTRAAERLHMAQQPLSAAIARLEQQLGVPLFERTTRHVALTAAGGAMLDPARATLHAADLAVAAARGHRGRLAVGVSPSAWYGLEPLFAAQRDELPHVQLEVRQQSTNSLLDAVRERAVDVAVGLCVQAVPDLRLQRLKDEPVLLAVGHDHPLAADEPTDLSAASDATFALDEPDDGPGYNAAVVAACHAAGFRPRTAHFATHHDAWQNAIARDGLVGLTVASGVYAHHPGLRLVPLRATTTFPLDLVTLPDAERTDASVTAFLEIAARTSAAEGWV